MIFLAIIVVKTLRRLKMIMRQVVLMLRILLGTYTISYIPLLLLILDWIGLDVYPY